MREQPIPIEIILDEGQILRSEDHSNNCCKVLLVSFEKVHSNLPCNSLSSKYKRVSLTLENLRESNISLVKASGYQSYKVVSKKKDKYGDSSFVDLCFTNDGEIEVKNYGSIDVSTQEDIDDGSSTSTTVSPDSSEISTPSSGSSRSQRASRRMMQRSINYNKVELKPLTS
ncbi:hypothetical protein BN7_2775 [Wickerhamomyces ciferrii]|uniref:Uncharacterized protein n=1 Tax=Wickerhamomyces ciferrii (strain ATCC 14091 / BCRC 22168 / CBS 111 / JCM 3599 / NBRC 0793 / NRRL Y-1031 F-60-10) TaxID=1206466 RepID=K0KPX5_WICCF|nr:uncharacterized protein BN7_2775 [Wickerhamomyces ciferrii]CCH43228.1 hypothetical protein BN7_2775 [Wickerhamomyces ciferrii]